MNDSSQAPEKKTQVAEPKPTITCPRLLDSCTLEDIKGMTKIVPASINYFTYLNIVSLLVYFIFSTDSVRLATLHVAHPPCDVASKRTGMEILGDTHHEDRPGICDVARLLRCEFPTYKLHKTLPFKNKM